MNFNVEKKDLSYIKRIAERAVAVADRHAIQYDLLEAHMDITACHSNGCPLDFKKLAEASESDFVHDVFGIRRHIDHSTGELTDCFLPRCALPELTAASA